MYSMTGFAQIQAQTSLCALDMQMRSYNNRYAEIGIHLPASLSHLEQWTREKILACIYRAKLHFSCQLSYHGALPYTSHPEKASAFAHMLEDLKKHNLQPQYNFTDLRNYGVFEEQNDADLEKVYQNSVQTLMGEFVKSRAQEGAALQKDIQNHLVLLNTLILKIKHIIPQADAQYTQKIREQFLEITADQASEKRILEEIAAYLIKVNVHEEVIRLEAHLEAMTQACQEKDSIGRKIDFLCQEIQREITTLSNKTPQVDLQLLAVEFKSILEKIREQARNVE